MTTARIPRPTTRCPPSATPDLTTSQGSSTPPPPRLACRVGAVLGSACGTPAQPLSIPMPRGCPTLPPPPPPTSTTNNRSSSSSCSEGPGTRATPPGDSRVLLGRPTPCPQGEAPSEQGEGLGRHKCQLDRIPPIRESLLFPWRPCFELPLCRLSVRPSVCVSVHLCVGLCCCRSRTTINPPGSRDHVSEHACTEFSCLHNPENLVGPLGVGL